MHSSEGLMHVCMHCSTCQVFAACLVCCGELCRNLSKVAFPSHLVLHCSTPALCHALLQPTCDSRTITLKLSLLYGKFCNSLQIIPVV
jgi:hypothetical protein